MITILCSGSRGDFQPYIALAQELKNLKKDIRIVGMREFEGFVRSYGIDFYPVQADFKTLNVDENIIKEAQSADNLFKMLLTFNKMKNYGLSIANEFYAACEGSELILYHPGCTIGYFAAEKLGIPSVLASPFPINKTKEQTSVIQYGRVKSTPFRNIISYHMLQGMLWLASSNSVKHLWKKEFGGLPKNFGKPYDRHTNKKQPAVISCSNYVFKRPKDWNKNIHQCGYWFVKELNEYKPTKEIEDFLCKGEKPIYIGFGSVFHKDQKETLSNLIIDALSKANKRGIICGMGKIENLPNNIIAIDSIPHSWLFEKVAAVCHHGGAGTTSAGFAAGVPSIIIPFANDQHAWAHRAYDLGVGSKPISIKKLTSDNLAESIKYALHDKIIENAKKLALNISNENGAKDCAKVIVDSLRK